MTAFSPRTFALASLVTATLLVGCGDSGEESAVRNVERSEKIMADSYDEERKQGEGRVEAAGDAYNEVLDAARE